MRNLLITILVPLLASPALAQAGGDPGTTGPVDYRWAVYTACSLVFAAILVFLVITHRRGARLAADLSHLARRVDSIEGQ